MRKSNSKSVNLCSSLGEEMYFKTTIHNTPIVIYKNEYLKYPYEIILLARFWNCQCFCISPRLDCQLTKDDTTADCFVHYILRYPQLSGICVFSPNHLYYSASMIETEQFIIRVQSDNYPGSLLANH